MKINTSIDWEGKVYKIEYEDMDDFSSLSMELCTQVYGVCFIGNEMVVVRNGLRNTWGLPGGSIEKGETIEQTFKREMKEEANVEVLKWVPIGVQGVRSSDNHLTYQLRVCALVKEIGDFVSDSGGNVVERKLINPADYKKYFDWGKVADRIIERGLELKPKL